MVADRPARTRVPVAADERPREPAIDWCRHEVRRIVAWHLLVTSTVVLAVVVPWCWRQFDSVALAFGAGVAAAVVVAAARIAIVVLAGPLGFTFVRTFTASPPEYLLAHQRVVATQPPVDLWDLDPNEEIPPEPLEPRHDTDGMAAMSDDPHPERRLAIADVLREMGFTPTATVRADALKLVLRLA